MSVLRPCHWKSRDRLRLWAAEGGEPPKSEFSVILQSRAGIRARLLEATTKGKCLMDKEDNKTAAQSLAEKSERRDDAQGGPGPASGKCRLLPAEFGPAGHPGRGPRGRRAREDETGCPRDHWPSLGATSLFANVGRQVVLGLALRTCHRCCSRAGAWPSPTPRH